jgi:hypothetical protein
MIRILLLIIVCLLTACNKTENASAKRSAMDSIVDGTFATDKAMQEERIEQNNYINEQEQLYE